MPEKGVRSCGTRVQVVVNLHVDAGNQTQVLCNNRGFSLLSRLSVCHRENYLQIQKNKTFGECFRDTRALNYLGESIRKLFHLVPLNYWCGNLAFVLRT